MTHTLLPIAYAGPISHWIPICKEQTIVWEVEDNYQKQTYRNRMEIHAANGKLMLSIPIKPVSYTHLTLPTNREVIYHIRNIQKMGMTDMLFLWITNAFFAREMCWQSTHPCTFDDHHNQGV